MKKTIQIGIIALFTLTLSGCLGFGSDSTPADTATTGSTESTTYQNSEFSITIPKDWEIIESKDFSDRVASNTLIVFRNNIKNDVFTANINIITNERLNDKSSDEHAKDIINSEKATMLDYKELIRETVSLQNGANTESSEFIVFEGRNSAEEDLIRYAQTCLVKNDKVYIVTGSYRPTEDEKITQLIQDGVKHFSLK